MFLVDKIMLKYREYHLSINFKNEIEMNRIGGFNKRKNQGIYVSLDIGTTSIKVVVAEYVRGQLNIIESAMKIRRIKPWSHR